METQWGGLSSSPGISSGYTTAFTLVQTVTVEEPLPKLPQGSPCFFGSGRRCLNACANSLLLLEAHFSFLRRKRGDTCFSKPVTVTV